jgi:hypothetical protein
MTTTAPIIGTPTCANCAHSFSENGPAGPQLFCRLNPPSAVPLIALIKVAAKDQNGADVEILRPQASGWTASFPPVSPAARCGQHRKPLLAAA